eukprot:jgi/Mesvir1/25407/Mv01441-RA.1
MSNVLIGGIAVLGSILFFGSFGVPIKSPAVIAAKVDPIVYQAYKTFACFATCWLVLIYTDLKFTKWGFVGAAIWVVNGTCAIVAIRWAGLSVAQSLWSGLSIFVSFLWGAYVFAEPIVDMPLTLLALAFMAAGMAGLAIAASSKPRQRSPHDGDSLLRRELDSSGDEKGHPAGGKRGAALRKLEEGKPLLRDSFGKQADKDHRFAQGLALAAYVGVANGSFMTPLKYANTEVKGVEYLVSFGVGAFVVTAVLLLAYFTGLRMMGRPVPDFQFRVAAKPALTTGLLWSVGNFCSIYATQYLGMAVGWPLVQCQLLVSGLWGIFYYEEVTGSRAIALFFLSALVVLAGVVMLSIFGLGL